MLRRPTSFRPATIWNACFFWVGEGILFMQIISIKKPVKFLKKTIYHQGSKDTKGKNFVFYFFLRDHSVYYVFKVKKTVYQQDTIYTKVESIFSVCFLLFFFVSFVPLWYKKNFEWFTTKCLSAQRGKTNFSSCLLRELRVLEVKFFLYFLVILSLIFEMRFGIGDCGQFANTGSYYVLILRYWNNLCPK